MNVHYAKFQKKFDSRTISRELPYLSGFNEFGNLGFDIHIWLSFRAEGKLSNVVNISETVSNGNHEYPLPRSFRFCGAASSFNSKK